MNKYFFIKASIDWADEFNCEFFGVFTEECWNDILRKTKLALSKVNDEREKEIYFGTNESLQVSSYEDWLKSLDIREISEVDAEVICNLFGMTNALKDFSFFTWGTGDGYLINISESFDEEIQE